jgi:hypothetical protein
MYPRLPFHINYDSVDTAAADMLNSLHAVLDLDATETLIVRPASRSSEADELLLSSVTAALSRLPVHRECHQQV